MGQEENALSILPSWVKMGMELPCQKNGFNISSQWDEINPWLHSQSKMDYDSWPASFGTIGFGKR